MLGNTGGAASDIYYKDTVSPSASITYPANNDEIDGIVNIKGTSTDDNLNNWKLEYGTGESPSSYQILAQRITAKTNEILHSWDVSSFTEQSRHTLKLTAKDKAGNIKVSSVVLTKSLDPQNSPSDITITSPTQGEEITQADSIVQYNNDLQNIEK